MAQTEKAEDRKTTAKERIMNAALAVFAEKGYSGTTTREIVRKAGSSLSRLDLFFGSKENLYKEVLNEILAVYVFDTLPLFGEIVNEREAGRLNQEKVWNYIEKLTDIHIRIITNPENRYKIMLLNRVLQDKEQFDINLEPALMYMYNYQMLFEEYTGSEYGRWWARVLSFQTVTGMFNLLTYPNLLVPLKEVDGYILKESLDSEEVIEFIKGYHLTAIRSVLNTHLQ